MTPLAGVSTRCVCLGLHVRLRGQSPWGFAWTKLAEAYPQGVAEIVGLSSAIAALGLARRLDVDKASERARHKTLNAETAEAAALERRRR